jgi:hypothetical protein
MKKEVYSVLLNDDFRITFFNKAISNFKNQTALATYLNSKIKKRKIIRENIKEWLRGKHHYGWDVLIPLDVIKELCVINSQDIDDVLNNAIKFNPPWKDPKNKEHLILNSKKYKTIKIDNQDYLDLASILPKTTLKSVRSHKKLPLFVSISADKIKLWSEANWKKSTIQTKRYVKLDETFFLGSAIYASEGTTKIEKYNDSISIGNTEPSIINLFFRWVDKYLENYQFNVELEFNTKKDNKEKSLNFWKTKVQSIKDSKIAQRERPNYGSRLIHNRGSLKIKISNTVLKAFIINLIEVSKKITLSKKEYSIQYLKGLMASEGSVSRPILKEVTIGCAIGKEREFIKRLLKNLSLTFTEGKNQLAITNWASFLFLYKNNVFEIPQVNSISKKDVFEVGFKNHQTTKRMLKLKRFKNEEFTAKDWQKEFNLKRYISAHKFLKKFTEDKIVLTKLKNNIKLYSINPKKKELLEQIWKIEKL